jgi:dTMP kinase
MPRLAQSIFTSRRVGVELGLRRPESLRRRPREARRSSPLHSIYLRPVLVAFPHSTSALACLTIVLMPRPPFLTFEGTEGCGKSTQVQRLAARYEAAGIPFLVTREPGGTPIGETIRELLQFAPQSSGMTPETELLLFEASRSQLVREVIKPALARGQSVIADRFFDSTTAYQGAARKLDLQVVAALNEFAVGDCIPDVTFILDVDTATAQARMQKPRRPDRMEQQPAEFYEHVRQAYRALAAREPKRVVLIDGSRSVETIADEIWMILKSRFPELANQSAIRDPQSAI